MTNFLPYVLTLTFHLSLPWYQFLWPIDSQHLRSDIFKLGMAVPVCLSTGEAKAEFLPFQG